MRVRIYGIEGQRFPTPRTPTLLSLRRFPMAHQSGRFIADAAMAGEYQDFHATDAYDGDKIDRKYMKTRSIHAGRLA